MLPAPSKTQFSQHHICRLLDGFADLSEKECQQWGDVSGLTMDSRHVGKGELFLACASVTSGESASHGIAYAGSAVKAGARYIAWEPMHDLQEMPQACEFDGNVVPLFRVEQLRHRAGIIASRFYDEPSKKLTVTGITGTNGKSSVSHFLAQAMTLLGKQTAVIGTLGNGIWGELNQSTHTTPDPVSLQKVMNEFVTLNVSDVAMEVSSHALEQGRSNGTAFETAVFTNLSRDHLDYHGDMQSYGEAKERLFKTDGLKQAIINLDDEFGSALYEKYKDTLATVSYGLSNSADIFADNIVFNRDGISFDVHYQSQTASVNANLFAEFNVSNLLAVMAVLVAKELTLDKAAEVINSLLPITGRMQDVGCSGEIKVIVDYAHTPDGLSEALKGMQQHFSEQPIICVFGCGGDRDQGKRALMGEVAQQYAQEIILTNDNPRSEDPEAIIADIKQGLSGDADVEVVLERREAIKQALVTAKAINGVVLIAGKGHEDYQLVGEKKLAFSDIDETRSLLQLLAKGSC